MIGISVAFVENGFKDLPGGSLFRVSAVVMIGRCLLKQSTKYSFLELSVLVGCQLGRSREWVIRARCQIRMI